MKKYTRKGLTLIELLLVMVIISTLVTGLILTFGCGIRARAFKAKACETLGTLAAATAGYYQEFAKYPATGAALKKEGYLGQDPNDDTVFSYAISGGDWTATKKKEPFASATITRKEDGTITESASDETSGSVGWDCN